MSDQLVFARILAEAEEQRHVALCHHRQLVQTWFDELPENHKRQLSEMLVTFEWDTHVALAVAAGDWRNTKHNGGKPCAQSVHVDQSSLR